MIDSNVVTCGLQILWLLSLFIYFEYYLGLVGSYSSMFYGLLKKLVLVLPELSDE
jgi:hypothetical protein